eukprot:g17957.t1
MLLCVACVVLQLVQFGPNVCYVISNTSHQWLNETFYFSFTTDADITIWSENPLLVAISTVSLFANYGVSGFGFEVFGIAFLRPVPTQAERLLCSVSGHEGGRGQPVVNGDTVTFVFPILNSNPNVNNGEAPSGPTYFQAHTAPITVGCELARSSQRFGGPGGTETASFSCRPNASVQALNISFSAPPGNALRAIQVTCSDGTASGWLGNTTELANETQAALTGIDKVTSLTVQYGLLVNRLGLGNLSSEVVGAEPPAPKHAAVGPAELSRRARYWLDDCLWE